MTCLKEVFVFAMLCLAWSSLFAQDYYSRQSLELGVERMSFSSRNTPATQSAFDINYYPTRGLSLGTKQGFTDFSERMAPGTLRYRPDLHIGFVLPLFEMLFAELTLGFDLASAVVAAAFLGSARNSPRIGNISTNGSYFGYFSATSSMRIHLDNFALKFIGQIQTGDYQKFSHNASAWLGVGVTYRFAL